MNLWRSRYAERGLAGLVEEQRPCRPRTVDRAKIIAATLTPPPNSLGVTHWSSRLLAPRLGVDHATVAAVWAEYLVKPWKADTFKFSTDPQLEAKVRDVIGLYESAGERDRALHRREVPGAGLEPDAEDAADAARTC